MRRLGKQAKRTSKDYRTAVGKVHRVAFMPPAARHLAYVSTSFLITYVPLALGLVILFQRVTQMDTQIHNTAAAGISETLGVQLSLGG